MSVVMLSGPIGAGKTTVAKELIAISPAPLSYLEGDSFWPFFTKPAPGPRHERFRLLMRSMTAAAIPLARGGYEVILDFSFPIEFLVTAQKILKEIPIDLVILRPSLETCAARAAARPAGPIPDYSNYRDFYAMFKGAEQHEICDDTADAASVARRIRNGIDEGTFRFT
jgi:chloramphenicol 3-O-phosphotransferase